MANNIGYLSSLLESRKQKCVRCEQLKNISELAGFEPGTNDYSAAYCRDVSLCGIAAMEIAIEKLLNDLNATDDKSE